MFGESLPVYTTMILPDGSHLSMTAWIGCWMIMVNRLANLWMVSLPSSTWKGWGLNGSGDQVYPTTPPTTPPLYGQQVGKPVDSVKK